MIQVYADGVLAYDSMLEKYDLLGLTVTTGTNKGGAAEITMPPNHPAYNLFVSYRTIVDIYRDGKHIFRGRALYSADKFDNIRTVTCEGELCLFQDSITRPYLFQGDPGTIFWNLVGAHNGQVEDFKRFTVDKVTVTDPNGYIRLESESAEPTLDTLKKLVERCGGYIVFSDIGAHTERFISWLADIESNNNQVIEFGENLLDFSRTGANTSLCTGVVPYGAKDEETGKRVDITSVNDGLDYIVAEDAQAVRGTILVSVTWDDVTEPANLLAKAQKYLQENRYLVTSLELTALDLSYMDKSLDSFRVGDTVRVKSPPHGVDEDFQLSEMTEDLLDPSQSRITLGKNIASLTAAAVAGDNASMGAVQSVQSSIKTDYTVNTALQIAASEQRMVSLIQQTSDSIELSVSGTLGGNAAIMLTVGDTVQTQTLDLSNVRQAFAGDTSAVTISAGTITFNSGTLVINSNYFRLDDMGNITATSGTVGGWTLKNYKLYAGDGVNVKTVAVQAPTENNLYVFAAGGTSHDSYADCPFRVTKAGKLYATDAVIYGDIITIDGSYKTELDRGSLRLYYGDNLCGTINTKYWTGASTEGICLRIEEAGSYVMFCSPNADHATGYQVDYYLNYGWSSNYDEKHIFQTSARFLDDVYFAGYTRIRSLRLFGANGEYLVGISADGKLEISKL